MILKAFHPFTLPLTVDPGAIAVAITIATSHAHRVGRIAVGPLAGVSGTAVIALSVWLACRYAQRVAPWLGHSRTMVLMRLSAFIVLCIGVEITWNGVKALVAELPAAAQAAKPGAVIDATARREAPRPATASPAPAARPEPRHMATASPA